MVLNAAESRECASPRFVVIELLLAREPLCLHLDVKADLFVDP